MEISVFEIGDTVQAETLNDIDKTNIDKIFTRIFDPSNVDHLRIDCCAKDESVISLYSKNPNTFQNEEFAKSLLNAELKKDGTRNKQITEGYLFIKKEESKISLLKLENIEVIDKEKNYEMRTSFSVESNYYKGCTYSGDLKKIIIIDKNKSVAQYWRQEFLNLDLNRNSYQNSQELISLLKNDTLFSKEIIDAEKYDDIKSETEDYIFDNKTFDKTQLMEVLKRKELIYDQTLNQLYSEEFKEIDTEFELSGTALREAFKRTIKINNRTKIITENYSQLIKRQGISFEDGKIILAVDNNYIDELPEELTENDRG